MLLKQLNEQEAAYQEFRRKAPLLWKGDAGGNLHEARMAEIEANRSRLMVLEAQTRSKIEAVQAAIDKGDRDSIVPMIETFVAARQAAAVVPRWSRAIAAGPDVSLKSNDVRAVLAQSYRPEKFATLEDLVASLSIKEQLALEDFGPDHPRVRDIRKEKQLVQDQIAAAAKGLFKTVDGKQVKQVDFVEAYQNSLRVELSWEQKEAEALDALFQQSATRPAG